MVNKMLQNYNLVDFRKLNLANRLYFQISNFRIKNIKYNPVKKSMGISQILLLVGIFCTENLVKPRQIFH